MMAAALLLSLFCPQEGLFTDKDAEDALKKMREEFEGATIEKRAAAVQEALKIEHEKVIRAMGDILTREPNPLRVAAAKALSDVDHPATIDVLVKAMPANQGRAEVMPEILKALGALGWQSACPPLHEYVKKVGDADVRAFLPEVIEALGRMGSVTSVDPLVDLLRKMEGGRRNPWINEGQLLRATEQALQAILGQNLRRSLDWDNYWRQNGDFLKAGMTRTYWMKKSQGRIDVAAQEKTPADAVLVAARLFPPQAQAQANTAEERRAARRRRRER